MYKVKASILSDDLMILDRAEIVILDRIGFLPIIITDGEINIDVPNENSKLQIEVFGYVTKTVTAKEVNKLGTIYMNDAVSVLTNPQNPKNDNTLLYILGAAGAIGLLYYATKKPTPKTVKIS